MKKHITKAVAVMMAVLMMMSLVPVSALPGLTLPAIKSVFGGNSSVIDSAVQADPDSASPEATGSDSSEANTNQLTIPTEDGKVVTPTNGENMYMAADGTLYMDTDKDGVAEAITGDTVADTEVPFNVQQGKEVINNETYDAAKASGTINNGPTGLTVIGKTSEGVELGVVPKSLSAYEPGEEVNNPDHPFLKGGSAWIDLSKIYYGAPATQNYPITKWSANTSVYNITGYGEYEEDVPAKVNGEQQYAFRDVDLIDGFTYAGYASNEKLPGIKGTVSSNDVKNGQAILTQKNGNVAFAYNRYDAMQGKYGITFDKYVKSAVWNPSYAAEYFPDGFDSGSSRDGLYNSVVYLSDTPYLYYSTEALDSTKVAISLLIGTPVQEEKRNSATEDGKNIGQTDAKNTKYYEYRWYTITDNTDRPGIENDTLDNSMIPLVTVSDVVAVVEGQNATGSSGTNAYFQQNSTAVSKAIENGKEDPIALAVADGVDKNSLYTNGSITGCIDFTNILPAIMGNTYSRVNAQGETEYYSQGREDIQAKVAQIRVDTDTAAGKSHSAFRINYMYFGPSLATVFTPQNTVGQNVDAQSWQYTQISSDSVGKDDTSVGSKAGSSDERAYTNGWENAETVTFTNTPNEPQKLTVDIYGQGDGKLIEWSEVPSGAALQGSNDSKVWKFTDKNGVVQYMEAERSKQLDGTYEYIVMVTVPVRKWINILGESRKLSLIATLNNKGGDSKDMNPVFSLWGNNYGALGNGHGRVSFGTRFRNEDIIMIFGRMGEVYHADGADYHTAEVDATIGNSVIWNEPGGTKESWFDIQRSPYVFDRTVKGANSQYGYGEELVGYSFITSMRFAMPIGSSMTLQNVKGDGNSAGLNTYSTSGHIVSAYDGGTGEQPIVDVSKQLPEKQVTITKTGTGETAADYTYTQSDLGDKKINGTITSGAAAYGPMMVQSFYTTYDLLDTELLTASDKGSHQNTEAGKNKQPVYGQAWLASDYLPIYHKPSTSEGSKYGYVYKDSQFIVYSTVKLSDQNNEKWGLVGVLTKNATTEIGWVRLWDGSKAYASPLAGLLYKEEEIKYSSYDAWHYPRSIIAGMKNDWIISNFKSVDDGADFRNGGNEKFEYTADFRKQNNSVYGANVQFDEAHNIINAGYGGPQLKYANMWTGTDGHYSAANSMHDSYLRAVYGTDMEWGFKRNKNTSQNLSLAMTRILQTPIVLKYNDIHKSYPVLYLDYTSTIGFNIGLSLRVDGKEDLWYIYGKNYIAPESHSVSAGNNFVYLSFEDMMTKDFKDAKKIEVTGVSLYYWNGPTVTDANVVLRRLEILQEETAWLDEIIADNQAAGGDSSTAMNALVRDSMNIVNDAFYSVHNEETDGTYTVVKDGNYSSTSNHYTDGVKGNIGVNNVNKGYKFTVTDNTQSETITYYKGNEKITEDRTVSYRKTNSNKGWSARITADTNHDGKINNQDTVHYSHEGAEIEDVYQYFSSLGHLRVWASAGTQTSVVFESDRSFNTKNYRYLYYSYSMRDTDTGIAAEEPDDNRTDGKKPGVAVSIKQNQHSSSNAYSEIVTADGTRTWAYYDAGNPYWAEDGRDNRTFKTTINAAADLSTFDGIESVNQFVFYLNNPMDTDAEFYINYLYLSNTPPEDLIKEKLEEEQVQYYYLMDNTGDRYSARFPSIDNPSGAIDGLTTDSDRNNPIIVTRGARLSDGHYFNGDPLYGYGELPPRRDPYV